MLMTEHRRRIRLCSTHELEPGAMKSVDIDGLPRLAVYRMGNEFFCSEDACTHGGSSLSDEGDLAGYVIECGLHSGKFDIRTGEPCAPPCTEPLRTFPVRRAGDDLYIDFD